MDLILSDRSLPIPEIERPSLTFFDLSKLKIANCMGCFGCWTKTPGKCVIRDDAVQVLSQDCRQQPGYVYQPNSVRQLRCPHENHVGTGHSGPAGIYPPLARGNPPCAAPGGAQTGGHHRIRDQIFGGTGGFSPSSGPQCAQYEFCGLPGGVYVGKRSAGYSPKGGFVVGKS